MTKRFFLNGRIATKLAIYPIMKAPPTKRSLEGLLIGFNVIDGKGVHRRWGCPFFESCWTSNRSRNRIIDKGLVALLDALVQASKQILHYKSAQWCHPRFVRFPTANLVRDGPNHLSLATSHRLGSREVEPTWMSTKTLHAAVEAPLVEGLNISWS